MGATAICLGTGGGRGIHRGGLHRGGKLGNPGGSRGLCRKYGVGWSCLGQKLPDTANAGHRFVDFRKIVGFIN